MINPAALGALAKGDLENFLAAASPGGIEAQEARGQRDMASQFKTLPKEMDRETAEAFGFKYLAEGGDDIFHGVEAPAGWIIRPTEHSMHSDIVDDKGRVRGSIFYKAAFYDRNASGHWTPRYRVLPNYDLEYNRVSIDVRDTATGESLQHFAVEESDLPRYAKADAAEAAASEWLAANFPDHRNPRAYW